MSPSVFPFAAFHNAKGHVLHREKRLLTGILCCRWLPFPVKMQLIENVVVQVTPYSERFMTDVRLRARFTAAVAISRVGSHCCCTTFVKSHAIMANEIE